MKYSFRPLVNTNFKTKTLEPLLIIYSVPVAQRVVKYTEISYI
ncbi:hypothetical protein [Algibacter lectus]|nr:hypothetical protein [Algibacter lectus]